MVSYTYPLTAPATVPARVTMRPYSAVADGRSPFTMKSDVQVYDGQLLIMDIVLPPLQDPDDSRAWEAFFLKMNGKQGTCLYGDPSISAPRGNYDSGMDTPLVDSSASPVPNQKGSQVLVTKGWRNNGSALLKIGDVIQLGSGATASIHKVLTEVNSDGSGLASIDIWPRLRRTPNDSDALTLSSPKGLFSLAENENPYDIGPAAFFGFSFTLVEAVRA